MNTAFVSATPTATDPLASLAREAQRDRGALGALLARLGPSVLRVARGVLGASHPDVEDAVQESLVEIASAMATFRGECTVTHFACRIAARRAVVVRRRARSQGEREQRIAEAEPPPAPSDRVASRRRDALR
ncbi:MAG: RNA polymerase subunit sigma, partial [Sandaracinaceae bacterium]|nr:RNA polymerase subunit sigma [Sandaracinaceae bacterium]